MPLCKMTDFKIGTQLTYALLIFSLPSCTIYLKDVVDGPPPKPTYQKSYQNAWAEGLDHEAAHRRALNASRGAYDETGIRRKKEKKERREKDRKAGRKSDRDLIEYRWD